MRFVLWEKRGNEKSFRGGGGLLHNGGERKND